MFSFFSTKCTNYLSLCSKCSFLFFSLPDSGETVLENESVVTLGELLGEGIGDTDKSCQPPELAGSNPSSRTRFHWKKFFKPCTMRPIQHLPSFPPSRLSNITKPRTKGIGSNTIQCNPYSSRTLVNFRLSDLRSATNNFSDGL